MKKALILIGSVFLCSLALLILILYFHFQGRMKAIPGLTGLPPCFDDPFLTFNSQESFIAWIENPNLGIDLTTRNPCNGVWHKHTSGKIYPLDYRYSIRSVGHRMFVEDRMYPLVYLQENVSPMGEYGQLFGTQMTWLFKDSDGNKYELVIRTDEKKAYTIKDTSTSPPTRKRQMSQEGDPYSIAPDPENYTVRQLGDETYYISKPLDIKPEMFYIRWFEGKHIATLYITSKKPFVYDAAAIDVSRYLSYFEMEFVDLPPLQEKSFPFLWVGIAGVICLGAGIGLLLVVRKHRNSKKSS